MYAVVLRAIRMVAIRVVGILIGCYCYVNMFYSAKYDSSSRPNYITRQMASKDMPGAMGSIASPSLLSIVSAASSPSPPPCRSPSRSVE